MEMQTNSNSKKANMYSMLDNIIILCANFGPPDSISGNFGSPDSISRNGIMIRVDYGDCVINLFENNLRIMNGKDYFHETDLGEALQYLRSKIN